MLSELIYILLTILGSLVCLKISCVCVRVYSTNATSLTNLYIHILCTCLEPLVWMPESYLR